MADCSEPQRRPRRRQSREWKEMKMDAAIKIRINLVVTNVLTRWPCHVCGGCTEKVEVLAEGGGGIRVCETCLKAGDIDARLEQHAAALEACAEEVRALIGCLQVPTYQEWLNMVESLHLGQVLMWTDKGDEFDEVAYFADPHRF